MWKYMKYRLLQLVFRALQPPVRWLYVAASWAYHTGMIYLAVCVCKARLEADDEI